LAYTFLYPLSLWYVLLYPRVRQRIRPYLRQRFPGQKGLILDLGRMYWLSLNFAQVLVDRASLGILGPDRFKIDFPDRDRFLELMGRDSGFILINSHVGSWQVAISAFEGLRRPVSMLMQKDRGDVDLPYYAHQGRPGPYQVIDPSDGVQAMLTLLGRLKQGELIGVMGDRAFGDDDNVVDVQFLGSRAWVPFSPYKLASASGATCLVLLTRRIGYQHYEVRLAREIEVPAGLGRDKEAFRYYAQAYARALEDFARDYPWQYFNFYDLWQG
jgi:predicted LPLAT superfamily acyltransferase